MDFHLFSPPPGSALGEADTFHRLLDISHLELVRDALKKSHFTDANWFDLGLKLKLPYPQLKNIEDSYGKNPPRCLTECLSLWLMSASTRTWETLAIALEDMDQNATAQHIRKTCKVT